MQTPKKVLITQGQLMNFSGSEIITLELAEYFSGLGADVTILTHFFARPISSEFEKLTNVHIVVSGSDAANNISLKDFDILWVHHFTLTRRIVRELANRQGTPMVIFHHMSKSEPLEFPIMYEAERKLADAVVFNSQETRDDLKAQGAEFDNGKVFILGNPAPDNFANASNHQDSRKGTPRKVAIVSNHPPKEVIDAAAILSRHGVEVDLFGRAEAGVAKRVTPELLSGYDAVVSIGKTVQYCIVGRIPIYCYDRFGGPGFLTHGNFALSRENNFSGRGFNKKSAQQIASEIIDQLAAAADDIKALSQEHSKEFLLSQRFNDLMASIGKNDDQRQPAGRLSVVEQNALASYSELLGKSLGAMLRWKARAAEAEAGLTRLRAANKELAEERKSLQSKVDSLQDKKLSKAGRAVRATIRKIIR